MEFFEALVKAGERQGVPQVMMLMMAQDIDRAMKKAGLPFRRQPKRRLEVQRDRLLEELSDAHEVPWTWRVLFRVLPRMVPPPWNLVLTAIFLTVEFTIDYLSDSILE